MNKVNLIQIFEKALFKYQVKSALKACNEDIKEWITVKGNHIPIKEGQTKKDVIKSFIDKKTNKLENIPTDNNGYSLKLKKSSNISINMKKAMEKGYYPEEMVRLTLPRNTKQGKELEKLFNENKVYKTNYKLKYEYEGAKPYWDDERQELVSSELIYFNTEEEMKNKIAKLKKDKNFKGILSQKEVKEWHHISGGGRSKLINIKKLKELGFNVDISTANKEFKL